MQRKVKEDLCEPLETETEDREAWSATEPDKRLGHWIWREGGRGEEPQLASLLPWLSLWVPRDWDKAVKGCMFGRERSCDPLEAG